MFINKLLVLLILVCSSSVSAGIVTYQQVFDNFAAGSPNTQSYWSVDFNNVIVPDTTPALSEVLFSFEFFNLDADNAGRNENMTVKVDGFTLLNQVTSGTLHNGIGNGTVNLLINASMSLTDYNSIASDGFMNWTFTGWEVADLGPSSPFSSYDQESVTVAVSYESNQVPEPTSLALLGLGLVGFGFSRKKKKA